MAERAHERDRARDRESRERLRAPSDDAASEIRHASKRLEERVELEPVGVVAHVSAWNYPHLLAAGVAASALVSGNAVLHKPSEKTPTVGARVEALLLEAGVPRGVFQTCQGGPEVGASLVALRGLGAIAFTGSTETGANIARAAVGDVGGTALSHSCGSRARDDGDARPPLASMIPWSSDRLTPRRDASVGFGHMRSSLPVCFFLSSPPSSPPSLFVELASEENPRVSCTCHTLFG